MDAASDQTCEMRHVDQEECANLVRDGAHPGKVELSGIGATTADDHLRLLAVSDGFKLVVIDSLGIAPHLIADHAIEFAGEVELMAVGKMAAVREIKTEDCIAGGEQRHVCRCVGLGAGVGLYVDVFRGEELFRTVAGEVFDDVGELASAVVAFARVALGVLIGEDSARRLQHRAADKVLGRDHLQPFMLAVDLVLDLLEYLRIRGGESGI